MNSEFKPCLHHKNCPGCSQWEISYNKQLTHKKNHLLALFSDISELPEIEIQSAGEHGLRQRFDYVYQNNHLGLIHQNKKFIPLDDCLQLTAKLKKAFHILNKTNLPIHKGSLRIRESSCDEKEKFGLWLDFANTDIKNLLVNKNELVQLSKDFFIEVGQKKKSLDEATFSKTQIKLAEPVMKKWFHTHDYQKKKIIPLYSAVSSFTQPSTRTAQLITDQIVEWSGNKPLKIIEFGCGIGQYTLPLLSLGHRVHVYENDLFALECLKKTASEHFLNNQLFIQAGDFQNPNNNTDSCDLAVTNPPKSGLKNFVKTVVSANAKQVIYISCYPQTLKTDAEYFLQNNYQIKKIVIIDQFPQTQHYEVAMLFQRINS